MITLLEVKKIVASPIVWILLLLFTAFNSYQIYMHAPMKDNMHLVNAIIDEHGTVMDEQGQANLKADYLEEMQAWNELSKKKQGQTYATMQDFFQAENYYSIMDNNVYSEKEMVYASNLAVKETYVLEAEEIVQRYHNINVEDLATNYIRLFRLSGEAAEVVKKHYHSFQPRFDELKQNDEYLSLFFNGKAYETHSFLFRSLFLSVMIEAALLIALVTSFIVNYEFDQRTALVTYSTKRGRQIVKNKLNAAIIASMTMVAFLLSSTLFTYFLVFDYSRLWHVPISSGFLTESNNMAFMSWWKLSFLQYVLLSCGLVFVTLFLVTLMIFVLSMWIRNSYVVFFLFFIIAGLFILLPGEIPRNSEWIIYAHYTPFSLMLGVKYWWMESGAFTTYKYYELVTVSVWFVLFATTSLFCIKRFYQQNLS
ncbi:hypothetical protein [Mangrovibacillus cuniculi]|uniref:Uncharacterized protein n=1 Tax=Mangrovibacillus cuniculi TaxID=2593652 RepID=A0A7S8HEN9_9BACI|nr:hypothetical protein [Mangrovibacillus cuniculi]QPC45590.1 hypothetical protein G8O30_00660 [Mangrovibacillus cuniculi]